MFFNCLDECFAFLEKKKVTKENSRQTRTLRAFCLASASLCAALIIDLLFVDCYKSIFPSLYQFFSLYFLQKKSSEQLCFSTEKTCSLPRMEKHLP
jgi:hypothetical protein